MVTDGMILSDVVAGEAAGKCGAISAVSSCRAKHVPAKAGEPGIHAFTWHQTPQGVDGGPEPVPGLVPGSRHDGAERALFVILTPVQQYQEDRLHENDRH
jgi:hypothetical protein